ncbi:pentatricopeptide repeat-containing protein At5g48910-like [Magnolia sinica]|uniref:pentatricopeptide repeat-containing protein At5g48910-like n=1 Tax=Magnolia sinica TaxID=86752 RepID=UPI00265806FC|nr:pentatricopeptide repeat-containing protein At5g48910-like [Magnolia sinica]
MLTLSSLSNPPIQSPLPDQQSLHVSLLQFCKNARDLQQIHASTLKTGTFHHPWIASRLLSLYSDPRIGNLDYALSIFERIPKPSSHSWNTMIKCFVENHRSNDAIALFCELLCESAIPPDNFMLPCVIKGCGRLRADEEGEQIHGLVLKIGFGSDVYVQSSLVSFYSKCGKITSARKVFDGMVEKDLVCWNSLIDGYVKCGEVDMAREVFDGMPERDSFSWTVLVDGYSKCGEIEVARGFFDRMPVRNVVSWNAMIDGYMRYGDFVSARRLFDKMMERNVITWNSMISGYERNGLYVEALAIFQAMLEAGMMPNNATLVGALSAVSGLGLLDKGRWIHLYMDRYGFKYDGGVLGTCLIDMYSKCGSIEDALDIFQAIPKKRLGHWTAIINGLGMHGMANHALDFFAEMQRIGIKPHPITFIGILNACSHVGLVDVGRRYFERMTNEYGITPTVEHYGCLVDLLCRAGHLEEAKDLIEKIPMRSNEVIWMSLLSGCRNHGNVDIGEYAAKRVIELAPDATGCYVLLSNIYATACRWADVSALRGMMKEKGVRKDPGCSSIEHAGFVHKFVVGDKSHPQTECIYSKLNEMGVRLRCAGYIPDTTQVLLCVEEEGKEVELAHHSERLAIAFGLINIEHRSPIRVVKNLRVCNDCHLVTKLLSDIYDREIIVRDNSRFHHFKNGSCSCKEYW